MLLKNEKVGFSHLKRMSPYCLASVFKCWIFLRTERCYSLLNNPIAEIRTKTPEHFSIRYALLDDQSPTGLLCQPV